MKHLLKFSLSILTVSLAFGCSSEAYKLSDGEKIVNQIIQETAEKLHRTKDLSLIETCAQTMCETGTLSMSFNHYKEVSLEQARNLIVCTINEYLSSLNGNKETRPYLHAYPLASKNLEIRIFNSSLDKHELPKEKVALVSSIGGVLQYYAHSEDSHPVCKETYHEALGEIAFRQGLEPQPRPVNEEVIVTEAIAKDGAKMRVCASSFKHSIYEMSGEGFKPHEILNCISTSCNEVLYHQVQADKDGILFGMISMPAVIGEPGGICRTDILRKGAPIQLKYPWGTEALR